MEQKNYNLMRIVMSSIISGIILISCRNEMQLTKVFVGEEFTLKLGESVSLVDSGEILTELQIYDINESRCPANVQCIRAGEAIVSIGLRGISQKLVSQELCIGDCSEFGIGWISEHTVTITVEGIQFTLILISVDPYPSLDDPPEIERMVTIIFDSYAK